MTAFLCALYRAPHKERTLALAQAHGIREDWALHYITQSMVERWPVRHG